MHLGLSNIQQFVVRSLELVSLYSQFEPLIHRAFFFFRMQVAQQTIFDPPYRDCGLEYAGMGRGLEVEVHRKNVGDVWTCQQFHCVSPREYAAQPLGMQAIK
jgi:hypothetical protein